MGNKIVNWIKAQEQGRIVVLRHEVAGISRREGSDWDIVVYDLEASRESLRSEVGEFDVCINRRYVNQHFLAGEQVDFFERFEWNGCCFLDFKRFWAQVRTGEDGIPRPSVAHDALIVLLVGLLGGGTFSMRYCPLMELALREDREEFAEALKWAVGVSASEDLLRIFGSGDYEAIPSRSASLRRALLRKQLSTNIVGNLKSIGLHWWTEVRHHVNSPFPFIAFLGPDGAGKSTVIEGVMAEFSKRRLHGYRLHWRPNFCKKGTGESQMVTDPHQVPPRAKLTSILKLFYFWADWFYSHHLPLRHLRAKNKVVIADRFYMDLLADPRRYRYGASLWPARKLFSFFPKPDLTIILTGDAETLYLRKKEVALDEVKRQIKVYEMLGECRAINPCVVTASRPLEEVHADVWRQVMSVLRNRT